LVSGIVVVSGLTLLWRESGKKKVEAI